MHPFLFFLLLSSGVSSYFLPLKKMPHLQNKTNYPLIEELLCLLETENKTTNEKFITPLQVQNQSCAHSNTEIFIQELKKIPIWKCVETGMQKLEKACCVLKKSPSKGERCSKAKRSLSVFKESLQEFLRWVNQKLDCKNPGGSELDLYLDGKCTCHHPWKSQQALG